MTGSDFPSFGYARLQNPANGAKSVSAEAAAEGDGGEVWEVLAVRHGRLHTRRSAFYLNYEEYGQPDGPLELGYWFWVIRNESRTIVVDTGYSAEGARQRGREILVTPEEALAALGIHPDYPLELVLTHAHYDHVGNLPLFPSQSIHMHPGEVRFWLGPDAQHRQFQSVVDVADIENLRGAVDANRVAWVEGNTRIAPEVTLVPVPGHTPGQLVVCVDTRVGKVVLASDACHLNEELDEDMAFKHNVDLVGLYQGLERLRAWRQRGALIIPGHEPSVMDSFPQLRGALHGHAVRIA